LPVVGNARSSVPNAETTKHAALATRLGCTRRSVIYIIR